MQVISWDNPIAKHEEGMPPGGIGPGTQFPIGFTKREMDQLMFRTKRLKLDLTPVDWSFTSTHKDPSGPDFTYIHCDEDGCHDDWHYAASDQNMSHTVLFNGYSGTTQLYEDEVHAWGRQFSNSKLIPGWQILTWLADYTQGGNETQVPQWDIIYHEHSRQGVAKDPIIINVDSHVRVYLDIYFGPETAFGQGSYIVEDLFYPYIELSIEMACWGALGCFAIWHLSENSLGWQKGDFMDAPPLSCSFLGRSLSMVGYCQDINKQDSSIVQHTFNPVPPEVTISYDTFFEYSDGHSACWDATTGAPVPGNWAAWSA